MNKRLAALTLFVAGLLLLGPSVTPAIAADATCTACANDYNPASCGKDATCTGLNTQAQLGCTMACSGAKPRARSEAPASLKQAWCYASCDGKFPASDPHRAICHTNGCDGVPFAEVNVVVPTFFCRDCSVDVKACKVRCQPMGAAAQAACLKSCDANGLSCGKDVLGHGCKNTDTGKSIKTAEKLAAEKRVADDAATVAVWMKDVAGVVTTQTLKWNDAYDTGYDDGVKRAAAAKAATDKAAADKGAAAKAEADKLKAQDAAAQSAINAVSNQKNAALVGFKSPNGSSYTSDGCRTHGFTEFHEGTCNCPAPTVWGVSGTNAKGSESCLCPVGMGRNSNGICAACGSDEMQGPNGSRTDYICVKKPVTELTRYTQRLNAVKTNQQALLPPIDKAGADARAAIDSQVAAHTKQADDALAAIQQKELLGLWVEGSGVAATWCSNGGVDKTKCSALATHLTTLYANLLACRKAVKSAADVSSSIRTIVDAAHSEVVTRQSVADKVLAQYQPGLPGGYEASVATEEGLVAAAADKYAKQKVLIDQNVSKQYLDLATTSCEPLSKDAEYVRTNKNDAAQAKCQTGQGFLANGLCGACPTGEAVLGDFRCGACPSGQVPTNGKCAACPSGQGVLATGTCGACPTGQGLIRGVCGACPAGQGFYPNGSCGPCGDGQAVRADGTCGVCPTGQGILPGTRCGACPVNQYVLMSGDKRCYNCPMGQVPGKDRISCVSCPPGQYPTKDGSSCAAR